MGTGCKKVERFNTPVANVVAVTWNDGRTETFYATPEVGKAAFGGTVHGSKGVEKSKNISWV